MAATEFSKGMSAMLDQLEFALGWANVSLLL